MAYHVVPSATAILSIARTFVSEAEALVVRDQILTLVSMNYYYLGRKDKLASWHISDTRSARPELLTCCR